MSKAVCNRQNHIICEFCTSEEYENCQYKRCTNLNLPRGSGLYLFDKIKKDDSEEKGIYDLWLREYHNIHKFCNPEPAKVDYIFFYPSQRIIFLIEISDLYHDLSRFLSEKLKDEVLSFLSQEGFSRKDIKEIKGYIHTQTLCIKKPKELLDFWANNLTAKLQSYIVSDDEIKLEQFKKKLNDLREKFLLNLNKFLEEFRLKKINELIKKVDDTLRIFAIFFEKVNRSCPFSDYIEKFSVKVSLIISPKKDDKQIRFALGSIRIERLNKKDVLIDNCRIMETFQFNFTDA